MESKELEINGRMNTVHSDGSISWIHGQWGTVVKSFGTRDYEGYMKMRIGGKSIRVHRVVAQAYLCEFMESLKVDHINGRRSDNRPENLRICTNAENLHGFREIRRGATSKYRGVSWRKLESKWRSAICVAGKEHHLGCFTGEIEAAESYDAAVKRLGLPNEGLNFNTI